MFLALNSPGSAAIQVVHVSLAGIEEARDDPVVTEDDALDLGWTLSLSTSTSTQHLPPYLSQELGTREVLSLVFPPHQTGQQESGLRIILVVTLLGDVVVRTELLGLLQQVILLGDLQLKVPDLVLTIRAELFLWWQVVNTVQDCPVVLQVRGLETTELLQHSQVSLALLGPAQHHSLNSRGCGLRAGRTGEWECCDQKYYADMLGHPSHYLQI